MTVEKLTNALYELLSCTIVKVGNIAMKGKEYVFDMDTIKFEKSIMGDN